MCVQPTGDKKQGQAKDLNTRRGRKRAREKEWRNFRDEKNNFGTKTR